MARLIANARMYAVTPAVEAAWRRLLEHVGQAAGAPLAYEAYAAPKPLDELWAREDLGLVFMCGWPFASRLSEAQPVAAPIPAAARFGGRPVYATDFIVRADSRFGTLADTFGHRLGWTVAHSQSGFNAVRHHLLRYRGTDRRPLFAKAVGPLVTARRVVQAVLAGEIDVGPLDAYWRELLAAHEPGTAARLRSVETTELAPAPLLVASRSVDPDVVTRFRQACMALAPGGELGPVLADLRLSGFTEVALCDYQLPLDQAAGAERAGYPAPG